MTLTCPHCGYTREVDAARVPDRPVRVSCPGCGEIFPFSKPAQEASPGPEFPEPVEAAEPAAGIRSDIPPAVAAAFATAALPKAGFWVRVVAAVADAAILGLLETLLGTLLAGAGGIEPGFASAEALGMMAFLGFFGMVLGFAYRVFFIGYCGQTPGKMAVKIRVIRTDGVEIGYGRAFLREVVGKFLSKLILGVGYLMVAYDRQKQGLHDKIADTYVIQL